MEKFIAALMIAGFIFAGSGNFAAYASGSLREIEYQRKNKKRVKDVSSSRERSRPKISGALNVKGKNSQKLNGESNVKQEETTLTTVA